MRRSDYIPSDWPMRAEQHFAQVTPAHPVSAERNTHEVPFPAFQLDFHPSLEVGIGLAGEEERVFADLILPVRAGDVWLGATWEPHGFRVTVPQTHVLVIMFSPQFLGEELLGDLPWLGLFTPPPSGRPQVTDERTRARVLRLAQEILEEVEGERKAAGWECAVRLSLLQLLFALARGWTPPDSHASRPRTYASDLARIVPVTSKLYADPSQHLPLQQAAAECGLGIARFSEIFRRTLGMSFGRFCLHSRLALAAQQLIATDLAIEDIAAAAGFVDDSHLHHQFRKHYDCTPANYRRRFRE